MPRDVAAIQAEITSLEAYLQSPDSLVSSAGSRGTSLTRPNREQVSKSLQRLYAELDRANGASPMFVRGVVRGLGRR